jgi:hypothetical protein
MPLHVGHPDRIRWKSFLRLALPLAAVVGVSLAVYPALLLLLLPGSVIVAIQLYRRRQPGPLRTSQGAKMGALIGSISFGVYALLFGMKVAADPAEFRQQMSTLIQEAIARNPTPEARQMAESLFSGTGGLVFFFGVGMALLLVFLLVFGSVSGALAARFFKEKSL